MTTPEFASAPILLEAGAGLGRPRRIRQFLIVSTAALIVLAGVWAVIALTIPHYPLLIADLILIVVGITVLSLIRARLIAAAVHLLLISLLIWIPAMAFFVSGSGVEHRGAVHYWLLVIMVGLHFVLFDAARVIQTFYVAVAILLFIVIQYGLIAMEPRFAFPAQDRLFTHGLTVGLVLIAIAASMRTFIASLADSEARAREANQRTEQLIMNMLPRSVISRVRSEGKTFAQRIDSCSILFADIVGFTPMAARMSPEALVALLNGIFTQFDELTERCGVEKIKTIGDGYMAAAGLPDQQADHAVRIARLALAIRELITESEDLSVRIGISSGPVVAGIIGQRRLTYDLWGETVNLASRMESHGTDGCIQVSESTYHLLRDQFDFEMRGAIEVKGSTGPVTTYLLRGEKSE